MHTIMLCPSTDGYGGWIANGANQYLRIDLLTLHDVDKLVMQGVGPSHHALTTQFKVQYTYVLFDYAFLYSINDF